MAPDQFDAWLGDRFAAARTVRDDGFSRRILAELEARARRDRWRAWLLLPVMVVGALLTAGQATPLAEQLVAWWPEGVAVDGAAGVIDEALRNTTVLLGLGAVAATAMIFVLAEDGG